tara:strand:+ start:452 stop:754 length:303 start_codon:yes stop_codon:yes gene_type:complete
MQTLTAEDQDILVEFKDLNIVQILLELLQSYQQNPIMICQVLSNLTNLALNDQINSRIRLQGAHLVGSILMENCPVLMKDRLVRDEKLQKGVLLKVYSEE